MIPITVTLSKFKMSCMSKNAVMLLKNPAFKPLEFSKNPEKLNSFNKVNAANVKVLIEDIDG